MIDGTGSRFFYKRSKGNKKDSDTPSQADGGLSSKLAFEQMIYFVADGVKIIQS